MDSVHELAPFYVLDALDPSERAAFEEHLPTCAECRREIAELEPGVEALARSVAEPAPPSMRSTVMDAVDAEASDVARPVESDDSVTALRSRRSMVVGALVAVAALLAVVFGVGLGSSNPDGATIDSILAASDRSVVEIQTGVASFAEVVFLPASEEGVFIADGLAALADDATYQLWLIGPDGPISAGVFRPESDGSARVLLEGSVRSGLTLGLTVEPAGGSPQPTGEVLLAEEI